MGCAAGTAPSEGVETPPDGAQVVSRPYIFSSQYQLGDIYQGIRILGALELRRREINRLPMVELSGLAWDDDDGLLYAVSDGGTLFQLEPRFEEGRLTEVTAHRGYQLRDQSGQALVGAASDSEGMDIINGRDGIRGNATLAVSFERLPRLEEITPTGRWVRSLPIAPVHRTLSNFRDPNQALEATAYHPTLGWLTAPERSLEMEKTIGIRSANGHVVRYQRYPARHSGLVAFEPLADGSLLTVERSFDPATATLIVALRRTTVLDGTLQVQTPQVQDVAIFDSRGDITVDNFEGLTRHRGNRFFLVSDDNDNFFQRTLLIYFELLDE